MGRRILKDIETAHKAPIKTILAELAESGLNKTSAAEKLGVTKKTLLAWVKKNEIDWPSYTKEHKENRTSYLRSTCLYHIEHEGQIIPLFEAAQKENICYKVVLERYKKGDRGKKLFRKVRSYTQIPAPEKIGLTEHEWNLACELAEDIGAKRASEKFNIKMSYLSTALSRRKKKRPVASP